MIKFIDISNFGCFKDFVWSDSVRHHNNDPSNFKKLNILYGRNYSGKTTLSRIFRSLQTGVLPKNYESPLFTVSTSLGDISQTQIPSVDDEIRVYNTDFVDEHLEFLKDPDGDITPFAIIGSENKAVELEIRKKTKTLGSEEDKEGLRHEAATKSGEYSKKKKARDVAANNIKTKLTNKATKPPGGIKHNTVYRDPNYNTPKIEADIKTIRSKSLTVLPAAERVAKEALLTEVSLPDIPTKIEFESSIDDLCKDAAALVSKKITPTQPIQDLLDDAVLQAWVKSGIPLHRKSRADCGFCGQPLPPDLWRILDEHFSQESADLDVALQVHLRAIESEKEILKNIITVGPNDFYSTNQKLFIDERVTLNVEIDNYLGVLDNLANVIKARSADIFTQKSIPPQNDNSVRIGKALSKVNDLIEKNNAKTKTLAEDQTAARTELRLSEIAQFIEDINLQEEEESLAELGQDCEALKSELEDLQESVRDLEEEIANLRIQLKDERKGADKVNQYLTHYFGHGALRLDAIEDTESSAFHFRILRGDDPAYNLSEGECSLVAFCYFIAKLEDTDSINRKLIIYIDDPVSSLDNNHIFFVFSLIEAILAAPEEDADGNKILGADNKLIFRYEQLFISTHNLEFLKYLKRLSRPKKDNEHFLLMAKDGRSDFGLMPDYLRNYVTEFNFLFGEIYTCSDAKNAATHHHCFYGFGNNLRKFLEAYLFFKYPAATGDSSVTSRVKTFFRNGPGTDVLVQRITNEFSHLAEMPDRGVQPIDYNEIATLAAFVLKKIKDSDGEQFSCFLQSIGKPDPFAT